MDYENETVQQQLRELQNQFRELSLTMQQQMRRGRTPPRYHAENEEDDDQSNDGDYNPYGRRHRNTNCSSDIKVDIPEYDGRLDPDEFVEWLRTVERVFDYKQTPEEKKVKIVALKLRKYASTWWANVCTKREKQGKEKVRSWSKMKKLLKSKFMPMYYLQESFSKLHFIKQGARTVEEYSQEFEHLLMKCDLNEDDPQTLVRYLGGLEPKIANVVELHPYSTLAELTVMAHKVESQQMAKGKAEESKLSIKPTSAASTIPTSSKFTELPENSNTVSRHARRCFRCQGLGHIASECPNKRVITLAEFESLVGPKSDEEPNPQHDKDEVILGPDDGELLVLRRALTGTVGHTENLQREALFRSHCTVKDKVCSMVIDGGSCTNGASQVMISKLSLPTNPHPSPYDIHWLNQGKGIRVTHRVLLSLSIGRSYTDEIWCDILPMDACHVLLGRPWLFDRRVVHDGHKNTYSFVKDGRNITLRPLLPTDMLTHQTSSANMILRPSLQEFPYDNTLDCELDVDYQSLRSNFFKGGEDDSSGSTRPKSRWDRLLDVG